MLRQATVSTQLSEIRRQLQEATFPEYLTTEVGGKTRDQLISELKSGGFSVSDWARKIIFHPAWMPSQKTPVAFTRIGIRDLGFTKSPVTHEIWARIIERGHRLCEADDAPAIRLALSDQPCRDYIWVAMEPIVCSPEGPSIFHIDRDREGIRWLGADWYGPAGLWNLDDEIIFRLSR